MTYNVVSGLLSLYSLDFVCCKEVVTNRSLELYSSTTQASERALVPSIRPALAGVAAGLVQLSLTSQRRRASGTECPADGRTFIFTVLVHQLPHTASNTHTYACCQQKWCVPLSSAALWLHDTTLCSDLSNCAGVMRPHMHRLWRRTGGRLVLSVNSLLRCVVLSDVFVLVTSSRVVSWYRMEAAEITD